MHLYIHIPFCRSKCTYCAFYSIPFSKGSDQLEKYIQLVQKEIFFISKFIDQPLSSIFFGGGTPSLLEVQQIESIFNTIRAHFSITDTCEVSLEANPDSACDSSWLNGIYNLGINRLSFGVQSFDHTDIKFLERRHSPQQAIEAISLAQNVGFSSINLDLMWGLPILSMKNAVSHWINNLQQAIKLRPHHISTYFLTIEKNTPLQYRITSLNNIKFPDEKTEELLYKEGINLLESYGYHQYEISNFARQGHCCRHNISYWTGKDYAGVGPAAVSTIKGNRYSNPENFLEWSHQVSECRQGTVENISPKTKLKELLMLGLRMKKGLSLKLWEQAGGDPFLSTFSHTLKPLGEANLINISETEVCLTETGMYVSDAVITHLFDSAFFS